MKKKILLGLVASVLSFGVLAEQVDFRGTVTTSCAFSNYTTGGLVAHTTGGYYYLDGNMNGAGAPGSVTVTYAGAPTFTITGTSSLDSAPGGTPNISQFNSGVSFSDALNQAAALAVGANNVTGGQSANFRLDDTNVSQDTATVRLSARASAPFPTGNYTAHVTISCQ